MIAGAERLVSPCREHVSTRAYVELALRNATGKPPMRGWNHLLPVIVLTAVASGFHQQPGYPAVASTAGADDERPLRIGEFAVTTSVRAITSRHVILPLRGFIVQRWYPRETAIGNDIRRE